MKFTKMHGCGNDYIYVDCFEEKIKDEKAAAIAVCDRHFGIGSDGLILIKKGSLADFEMVIYNPDGSRAEMCGNAIRCVARYVYDKKYTKSADFTIESAGRVKYINLFFDKGEVSLIKVDMGAPELTAALVPVVSAKDKVIGEKITAGGREFEMTCVSMGNPHAVMFIEDELKSFDLNYYGSLFEKNTKVFPNRVNAEFAKIIDKSNIEMRVYERGTGETLACGTGTCATVVAAVLNGLTGGEVTVHLLGGDLNISWSGNENDSVFMTGPAQYVFTGEINL
ncbi:MAG: diaminopimelate epimerase [Clostridiales bacterium]|nr:diaminopimelate epimerase [Clostridiales bacterium]